MTFPSSGRVFICLCLELGLEPEMNSKLALIAFIVCQAYPILSQQQGTNNPSNPSQPLVPGGWFRPLYSAAAEAWRDYLIRAQQATNQFYQQWANLTGINNQAGGFGGLGGLGGLYGGGNQQQGATGQTPRPLQGIFSSANIPTGLDMSELLPGSQKPGRQGLNEQDPLEDTPQEDTAPKQPQEAQPLVAPPVQQTPKTQQTPAVQQAPVVQQAPPVQQPATVQQVPQIQQTPTVQQPATVQQAPQIQQSPPVQQPATVQQAPPAQQAPIVQQPATIQQAPPVQQQTQPKPQPQNQPSQQQQPQTQNRPLQTLGQAANTIGMFGGASPLGWMG